MSPHVSHWIEDSFADIVQLNAGDDIWIEVIENNFPFEIGGHSSAGPHSVFEGFLINC